MLCWTPSKRRPRRHSSKHPEGVCVRQGVPKDLATPPPSFEDMASPFACTAACRETQQTKLGVVVQSRAFSGKGYRALSSFSQLRIAPASTATIRYVRLLRLQAWLSMRVVAKVALPPASCAVWCAGSLRGGRSGARADSRGPSGDGGSAGWRVLLISCIGRRRRLASHRSRIDESRTSKRKRRATHA